jgi:uncharacterized protein
MLRQNFKDSCRMSRLSLGEGRGRPRPLFSKHNIFSKIKNSENYFIVNLLSGNADILDPVKAAEINSGEYSDVEEYLAKGYLTDPQAEEAVFKNAYLDFLDARDESEIQIFYVPWYACNFNCFYCYQDEYTQGDQSGPQDVTDAFFSYVKREFAGKQKYLTLFGGEPLLPGKNQREAVAYFMRQASAADLDVAVVTNGYHLSEYLDILNMASIREVQITLDGTAEVHNKRRPLKGGRETFDRVVQGIDDTLAAGIPVNLRIVIDKDNIENLPDLARLASDRGWTKNQLFKTQFGRNYELHHCQVDQSRLFDRVSLYETIYDLARKYPEILEFHRPAYSISRFLLENGELPDPLFDSCPGCKTEWAFDYTGSIYSCTATVGKESEQLGTFYPEVSRKDDIISEWEERDVLSIPQCRTCSLRLACGGGCASVAKNNSGTVTAPDCRPVKELLEMGLSLYFEKEL